MTQLTQSQNDHKSLFSTAGILYLLMMPLGVLGILYMPEHVLVLTDAKATFENLTEHQFVLRFSVLSALLIQIIQIFLVFCLYQILKPFGQTMAMFMVVFTITAVPIAMLNEIFVIAALDLVSSHPLLNLADIQKNELALFLLSLHEKGIMIVHIFWGLWLFPMGYLIFKSNIFSKWINKIVGASLMLGAFGYCLDTFTFFLTNSNKYMIAQYTFLGEVMLPVCLIVYAFKSNMKSKLKSQTA